MKTRAATLDDFQVLFTLWKDVGLQLYPEQDEQVRFESMVTLNPDLCILLEDNDGKVIGSILGGFDGRTASVHRLAIHPSLQKKGMGSDLLRELEQALRARGVKKLSAQIHITNTAVVPFYEKHGFNEMTYVKTYFKDI